MNISREDNEDRAWLAGRLNRDVPMNVWEVLRPPGKEDEGAEPQGGAFAGGESRSSQAYLVKHAKELLIYEDIARAMVSAPEWYDKDAEAPDRPSFNAYEEQRAQTLAEYVALRAAMHPRVCALREDRKVGQRSSIDDRQRELQPEVREQAEMVAETFGYYWSVDETLQFVLFDVVAWREPVWADTGETAERAACYGTIDLHIEPWVPVETVVEFYKHHQLKRMGRRPRTLSIRNLRVARFVLRQLRGAWYRQLLLMDRLPQEYGNWGAWYEMVARRYPLLEDVDLSGGPSWKLLLYLWNREHEDERYEDERRFRKDFYRAARAVVYPYSLLFGTRPDNTAIGERHPG